MKFPVDFLAGVSQAELQASAQSYMTELLYSNPDNQDHLTLPDSTKLPINISTVGQVPLYGSSDTEKVLALFAPADPITPAALYLVDRWWTMEDILHTAENTPDGAKQVETVGERIVLYVLNRIIYRAQEMSPDELPFLCHGETDYAKILWSNGEAVGFYSVKPTGSPCSPFSSRTYPFPVMDSMFVRKRCRGKGLGLKMLQDYVDSFKEDSLGVRYPLTTAMYKVCESYLQAFPGDSELLWEVDSSRLNQRITISNKIQSMNMRALSKTLTYSDKSGAIHHGTTEGAVMEEISRTVTETRCIHCSRETVEEVTIVRSKGCEEVPVSTRGRSTGSKRRTGQKQTEEQHSVIRITEEVNLSRLEKDSEVVQTEDLLNMAIENGTDITVTEEEEEEATFHKSLQRSEESVTLATEESITQNSLCSTVMPVENVASEMESSHTAETEEKLNHETIENTAPPQSQVTMERVTTLTTAAEDETDMEKPADEPEVTQETISVDNETAEDHTEEDEKEEPVIHRRPLKGRRSAKTPPRSTRTSKRHKTAEEEETEKDTEPGIELEKDIVEIAEQHTVEETEDTIEKTSEAVVSEIAADKEVSEQHEPEEVGETRVLRRSGRYQKTEEIVETTVMKRGRKSKGRVTRQKELELEASSAEEDVIEEPQTEHQTSTENTLALPVAEDLKATVVTETTEKQVETAEDTKEEELPQAEEDTVERAEEPVAAETEDTVEEMAVEDSGSAEAAEEEKIEEAASTADVELVPVSTTEAEHKEHSESSIEVDKESQPETAMEEKEAEPEEPEEPAPSVETRSLRSGSKTVKATPGRRRTAVRLASQEDTQDKPLEEIINQTEDTAGQSEADLVEPASEESPNEIKDNEKESFEALALEDEDLSAEQNDPEEVTISEATSVGHQAAVDVSDFPRVTVLLVDVNKVHVVKSVTEPKIAESAETTEDAENQNSSLNDEPAPEVETRRLRSRSKIVAATEDTQPSQQTSEEECSTKELIEEPLDHTEEKTEAEGVAEGTESSAVAQSTEETKAEEVQKSKEEDAEEQEDQDEPKTRPPKRTRKSASAHKRGRFKKARSKPQQNGDVELSSPQDEVTESEGTNDAMPATSLDSHNTQVAGAEESTQEELPETANEEKPIEDQVQQPEEGLEGETTVDQEAPAKDEISETEEAEVVSPDNIEDIPSEEESPAPTKTTRRGKPKRSSRKTAKVTSIDEETQAKEKIDETEEAEDVSPDNIEDLPSEEEAPTKTTRRSKPRRSSRKTARVDYADHEEELYSDIIPQSVAKSPAKTRRSARKPQSEEEEASDEGVELNLVLDDDEEQSASDLEVMWIGEKVLRNRAVPYIVSTPQSKSSPLHSAVHSPQESPKQPRKRRSAGATPARRSKRHRD